MKKLVVTSVVAGLLFFGSVYKVYGNNNGPVENSSKSTLITFNEVNKGAKLFIKDTEGQTLYSETIREAGSYSKKFDLSHLPENLYYFEVNKSEEITILPFLVNEEAVVLQKDLKTDIAKPVLYPREDKVYLTRAVDNAQPMKVDIYYEGRDLVYSEELNKDGNFVRKYDFSTSISGEYLFYIKYDDGRILSEYVEIN